MTTGQILLTTAQQKVLDLTDRRDIVALTPSADCYIGNNSSVTATTGHRLVANMPFYLSPGNPEFTAAEGSIYGITASGNSTLTFVVMDNQEKV